MIKTWKVEAWMFVFVNKRNVVVFTLQDRLEMTEYCEILASELQLEVVKPLKRIGGGSSGENLAFETTSGNIYAKISNDVHGRELLHGKFKSLEVLQNAKAVKVPRPIKVICSGNTTILITEYINFHGLETFQCELGKQLANLHLKNLELLKKNSNDAVQKFGFYTTVCCGKIPVDNQWNDDWVDFYCKQRLRPQIEMASKNFKNTEVKELWSLLEPKICQLFHNINVLPSLLHGDLWSGNAGETKDSPVIFDPASFYGHREFDLAITRMFGGFNKNFYQEYHKLIPRESGFEERKPLYELFHYLNHWNHFGSSYEGQSFKIMRKLLNALK